VTTKRVATLVAAARINDTGQALPILSNCLVPRTILTRIAKRFGDICKGASGDAPFLCRYLTVDDRFLHYDRSICVAYAPQRSAGMGYLRGEGGDFADYLQTYGARKWLDRAPIPGINLGHNMLFHEYEIVREQTGELPPIDFDAYLRALGEALAYKTNPAEREQLKQILESRGWSEPPLPSSPPRMTLRHAVGNVLRKLRLRREQTNGFPFDDDDAAIRFALAHPRRASKDRRHLEMIDAEEVRA
jgi:hypothetical protein